MQSDFNCDRPTILNTYQEIGKIFTQLEIFVNKPVTPSQFLRRFKNFKVLLKKYRRQCSHRLGTSEKRKFYIWLQVCQRSLYGTGLKVIIKKVNP